MSLCLGPLTMIATMSTALIGWGTPDNIRSYVSINADPWDYNEQVQFQEPMGSFGIETDIDPHVRLFAEHLSSPMQCDDHPGINHAGVKFLAPIDQLTIYSGVSFNSPGFDSNDSFNNPLVSVGAEYGFEDVKLFVEHLSSYDDFNGGRTGIGLKVFFK